ncbi:MAG: tryptophan--tRNA ligase [Candidatus Fermentithermobacillus carboniphilus]|uniref:Tryptophan--tRNA ligase n=1 Tax=Candidatus Fermentithermobacillus carboniphilus TaxID=3085328 RepID=A0AAT9LF25_9FIRM|nr:MAG: tryptophan--tRNA ligase [Candidatus Fermentithermobacillus carboniphilus]
MKRVFSGVQPSGVIHLGNYFGALKRFVDFQDEHECFYCIVDYHAITVYQDPKELSRQIEDTALYFLAAGLDPQKVTLFVQSDVPCHAELGWMLQCIATFGELSRMTQFKEKSEGKETVSGGLFTYPALMAADILLYDTDYVPVGEDQKQHVELCRDLAERFNSRYGPTFKVPEPLIPEYGARIKSLQDPTKKMSKSDPNPLSYISLADSKDEVARKIRRAVTDSGREVVYRPDEKPALANLLSIYSLCVNKPISEIEEMYRGRGYADFKKDLADVIIQTLEPVQKRYSEYKQSGVLKDILSNGAKRANEVSSAVLKRAKEAMGLSTLIDPVKRTI